MALGSVTLTFGIIDHPKMLFDNGEFLYEPRPGSKWLIGLGIGTIVTSLCCIVICIYSCGAGARQVDWNNGNASE